jgi:alginate O-acetyltransferase complex protein AlgF
MSTSPRHGSAPTRRFALLATLLLVWATVAAQPGLYGPEAPADSAWVRVVNAAAPGGMAVRVADAAAVVLPWGGASRYWQVSPGPVAVDVGGTQLELEVGPESFTTVAATPAGPLVVADPELRDASRGLLGLLNLTDRNLTLRVPDGTAVVADVPPGHHDALAVAQATTGLVITDGDEVLARLDPREYARGIAHAVVVFAGPDGFHAEVVSTVAD